MSLQFRLSASRLLCLHACLMLLTLGTFSTAGQAGGERGYSRDYYDCERCGRYSWAHSRFYYGSGRVHPRRVPPRGQGWRWNGRNSFYKGSRFYSGPAIRPGWRRW
mgnify:FL=1